jgi:hypothetical protein
VLKRWSEAVPCAPLVYLGKAKLNFMAVKMSYHFSKNELSFLSFFLFFNLDCKVSLHPSDSSNCNDTQVLVICPDIYVNYETISHMLLIPMFSCCFPFRINIAHKYLYSVVGGPHATPT